MKRSVVLAVALAGCGDDVAGGTSSGETGTPSCRAGETRACYGGPPGSEGEGPCRAGTQTCASAGEWGACAGEVLPAPADCDAVGDETCGTGSLCAGEPLWSRNFSGSYPGNQTTTAWGLAFAGSGDIFVAGSFIDSLDIDGLRLDIDMRSAVFLARFGPDGEVVWAQAFADTVTNLAPPVRRGSLQVAPSGAIVMTLLCNWSIDLGTGPLIGEQGDPAVAVFSADGALRWARRFEGLPPGLHAASGPGGSIRIAGALDGPGDLGGGPLDDPGHADVLIAEYTSDGELLRSAHWGDAGLQQASAIATAPDGDVVIAGVFQGDLDFGAGPLHSGGYDDVFLARLAPDLSLRWARSFPALGDQWVTGVSVDDDGGIVLAGGYYGGLDLGGGRFDELYVPATTFVTPEWEIRPQGFVARFDADGSHLWSRRLGVVAGVAPAGLSGRDGRFVLTGGFVEATAEILGGSLHGEESGRFVVAFDRDGAARWRWTFAPEELTWTLGDQAPVAAISPLGQIIAALPGLARVDLAGAAIGGDGRDFLSLAAFAP
jgi:hypothetical protein